MDGSLSNKPENFVDDPEKIYRQRRREARSRKPELVDSKVEADGSSSSPQATPPTSPRDGATGARAYDRRAMHSGRSGLADPKSRQHRSSVRDQDFNHKDGAKLALHWKRRS